MAGLREGALEADNRKEEIEMNDESRRLRDAIYCCRYRKNNREKVRAAKRRYYQNNREKLRVHQQVYRETNREKTRATVKRCQAVARATINDSYAKISMGHRLGVAASEVSDDLILLGRVLIEARRAINKARG